MARRHAPGLWGASQALSRQLPRLSPLTLGGRGSDGPSWGLWVKAVLPPAYAHLGTDGNADAFSLSTELSTDQRMVVSTSVAQAMHAGAPVAFLSLVAHTVDGDIVSHEDVLPQLDALHARLDGLFRQMTAAVEELMEPVGRDEVEDA